MSAEVTRHGVFDMRVCVPDDWTDEQVMEFSESECPCGPKGGWQIRRQGNEALAGNDERVSCQVLAGHVHITLDAAL